MESTPKQSFLQILSESGPLNSKILVKYSFQVGGSFLEDTKTDKDEIFAFDQVSRGMEFLEQHKIVHGDLAAR